MLRFHLCSVLNYSNSGSVYMVVIMKCSKTGVLEILQFELAYALIYVMEFNNRNVYMFDLDKK